MILLCRLFQACCIAIVGIALLFAAWGVWPMLIAVPFFLALSVAFGLAAKAERAARRFGP